MELETKHFAFDRYDRAHLISDAIGDNNNVVCINVIDRGHINGPERFELSDMGIIRVYNNISNRHITDLIARPKQIYERMGDSFRELPKELRDRIMMFARKHKELGYNWK